MKTQAQVNYIKTICGKDTAGYCCDGEAAVNAQLNYAYSLWIDKFDNIYIDDAFNMRIRKIDHSDGVITTVAGTGIGGYSGDNGPATNAQLFLPSGLCVDTDGNIYFSDAGNMVIRKIDVATNIITTIAGNGVSGDFGDGGPATNAQLNGPCGVCFDKAGNILFADEHNNKIRKVDITSGIITTVAGTGVNGYIGDNGPATNAKLNLPTEVCIDSSGNILFSDTGNEVVRKIEVSTGVVKTTVGTGIAGYSGDNGPAANAELDYPVGLFVDQQQNIFIADDANGSIRRISSVTGIITTVVGTGITGFGGDGGPATDAKLIPSDIFFDSNGSMLITDPGSNRIRKVYDLLAVKDPQEAEYYRLEVFPNPSKGKFDVKVVDRKEPTEMRICNALGEQVFSRIANSSQTEIDISDQPSGMYFLYMQFGEKQIVRKVAISH